MNRGAAGKGQYAPMHISLAFYFTVRRSPARIGTSLLIFSRLISIIEDEKLVQRLYQLHRFRQISTLYLKTASNYGQFTHKFHESDFSLSNVTGILSAAQVDAL
jgi:hypothetical protein